MDYRTTSNSEGRARLGSLASATAISSDLPNSVLKVRSESLTTQLNISRDVWMFWQRSFVEPYSGSLLADTNVQLQFEGFKIRVFRLGVVCSLLEADFFEIGLGQGRTYYYLALYLINFLNLEITIENLEKLEKVEKS